MKEGLFYPVICTYNDCDIDWSIDISDVIPNTPLSLLLVDYHYDYYDIIATARGSCVVVSFLAVPTHYDSKWLKSGENLPKMKVHRFG